MIKVTNREMPVIAHYYFNEIKQICLTRARFNRKIWDVLFAGSDHQELRRDNSHHLTKAAQINFLLVNKIRGLSNLTNVNVNNVHAWVTQYQQQIRLLSEYLSDETNLREIILVSPIDAEQLDDRLQRQFGLNQMPFAPELKNFVERILDYSIHTDYAYEVAYRIGIDTCPYCNRVPVHAIRSKTGKSIIRPTFDHFFPQDRHPFLALSFYNLVPCCNFCNSSTKHARRISHNTHLNPFMEGFDRDCIFKINIKQVHAQKSHRDNYEIEFFSNLQGNHPKYRQIFGQGPNEGNIDLFGLAEIYDVHRDVIGELRIKAEAYNKGHADALFKVIKLPGTNVKEEFYRFYFGNYYRERDFHKRPLSKLTNDTLRQLLPGFFR